MTKRRFVSLRVMRDVFTSRGLWLGFSRPTFVRHTIIGTRGRDVLVRDEYGREFFIGLIA